MAFATATANLNATATPPPLATVPWCIDVPLVAPAVATSVSIASTASHGEASCVGDGTTTIMIPNSAAVSRCTQRFADRLRHAAVTAQLPRLLWHAVLEECQAAWYSTTIATITTSTSLALQQQQQEHYHNGGTISGAASFATAPSPLSHSGLLFNYYLSTSEPLYGSGSSKQKRNDIDARFFGGDDQDCEFRLAHVVSFTPAVLLQRVKQGCATAWREMEQMQQHRDTSAAFATAMNSTNRRVGSRSNSAILQSQQQQQSQSHPKVPMQSSLQQQQQRQQYYDHSSPHALLKVKPGGRVALALLNQPQNDAAVIGNSCQDKTGENAHDESTRAVDDIGYDDMNENDDEGATAENDEQREKADDMDEEMDEHDAMVLKNPFLEPPRTAVIEWMGRKAAKTWSTTDVQPILAEQMVRHVRDGSKKSKSADVQSAGIDAGRLLSSTDRLMWCQMLLLQQQSQTHSALLSLPSMSSSRDSATALADFLFSDNCDARIVLELTGDGSADDVGSWDIASFGRTQFTVRIVNDVAEQVLRDHIQQQAASKQQDLKKQRLWESYRYNGIHTGYCHWGGPSSWLEAGTFPLVRHPWDWKKCARRPIGLQFITCNSRHWSKPSQKKCN